MPSVKTLVTEDKQNTAYGVVATKPIDNRCSVRIGALTVQAEIQTSDVPLIGTRVTLVKAGDTWAVISGGRLRNKSAMEVVIDG